MVCVENEPRIVENFLQIGIGHLRQQLPQPLLFLADIK